jgi:hypothetical protein
MCLILMGGQLTLKEPRLHFAAFLCTGAQLPWILLAGLLHWMNFLC